MKAFFGTTLGKVVIGVLVAAVVAGGGYGIYQAVQSDPVPAAAITDPTEEITTTEAPAATQAETTTEEEITEAPTEAPTAAPTAATTTTTTKATTITKASASSVELSKYINDSNGFFTVQGAELAKLLGYNSHVYRKSYEQDTWHTYSNSAGSEIGCGGNDDGRNADGIGAIIIKDTSATLYGLRVGDPTPQSNVLAAYGYTESSTYKGSFWLEDRVITIRTSDGKTISEIRYNPQMM